MELSEEHVHSHDDDVVEIHIPAWVLWTAGGIVTGLLAVVAWDVYTQRRLAIKRLADVRAHAESAIPLLDMRKVEEWANQKLSPPTVVQDEQPESPPL